MGNDTFLRGCAKCRRRSRTARFGCERGHVLHMSRFLLAGGGLFRLNAIQASSLTKGQEMKIETIHDMKAAPAKILAPEELAESVVKLITENTRPVSDSPERGKHLIMPRGIVMQCFTDGKGDRRYIGQYRHTDPTAGEASMPRRVYQIAVERCPDGGSFATIFEDDRVIASISTPLSRNVASGMALRSLYWFLAKRDKKNRRNLERRKRAKAAKREAEAKGVAE